MSDAYIRVIPTDPSFVPVSADAELARRLVALMFPQAQSVEAMVFDEIRFVDYGENIEEILCPACGADLESWWDDAVSDAAEVKFRNLDVVMPCCSANTTLNDLDYRWPMGLARFMIEAWNPDDQMAQGDVAKLELALRCSVRIIYAHV